MASSRKKSAETRADGSVNARAFLEGLVGKLTLGKTLRAIREGEGETLSAFAPKLGISLAYLSDLENGRRSVSPERAHRWALGLGYEPQQFVELALQAQLDDAGIALQVSVGPMLKEQAKAVPNLKRHNKLNLQFDHIGTSSKQFAAKAARPVKPRQKRSLRKSA